MVCENGDGKIQKKCGLCYDLVCFKANNELYISPCAGFDYLNLTSRFQYLNPTETKIRLNFSSLWCLE